VCSFYSDHYDVFISDVKQSFECDIFTYNTLTSSLNILYDITGDNDDTLVL